MEPITGILCRNCNLRDFVVENCERICTNCGDVQEELSDDTRLCILPDHDAILDSYKNKKADANQRLTGRIRNETNSSNTRRQICRERLIDDMRKMVKQLVKHPGAVDETMDLVDSVFKAFKGRLLNCKKLGLVGACIYYLSAKHQLGIALSDICKVLDIKMKVISACLKQVKQLCPEFEYERPNIKDLVKKYIDELALKTYNAYTIDEASSGTQPNRKPLIDNSDKIVLENRVMLLLDLFEAMHPFNQPTHQSLIIAVIYHAWRSLDTFKLIAVNLSSNMKSSALVPDKTNNSYNEGSEEQSHQQKCLNIRHKISFEKFCQICNLKYSSNGYRIVSKLQSSLLMLGKYLGDVNKINLPWYLKDIIENSPHLIQEHANRAGT